MAVKGTRTESLLERIRTGQSLTKTQQYQLIGLLAFPSVMAQLSSIAMQYIDAAMVGSLGAAGPAAVGLVSPAIWLFCGFNGAFGMGFSVQCAHRIGANQFEQAREVVAQGLVLVPLLAVLCAALGVFLSPYLPGWLGANVEIHDLASDYFAITVGTMPLIIVSWLSAALLKADGNMRTPSLLNIQMCFLDVVFNYLLIFPTRAVSFMGIDMMMPGAGLGVVGAACGTAAAELVTVSLMLYHLLARSAHLSILGRAVSFKPQRMVFKRALNISLPLAAERMVLSGAQLASMAIVAPLGVVALAAHSLAIVAESLCYMTGFGFSDAGVTAVGQTIGAKRKDLAKQLGLKCVLCGMVVMGLGGVVLYAVAPALMSLMTESVEAAALGAKVLRIEAFAEPLFAAAIVCCGVFAGAGDTMTPAIINLVSMWFVRIVLALILAPTWGLPGVWFAMCIELCLRGTAFLIRLRGNGWLDGNRGFFFRR